MRLIKYGHACVRLETGGRTLVIDPGTWSEAEALTGADAVLITHEHADHVDAEKLASFGGEIFAPASVAPMLEGRATTVEVGQTFTAAGFQVQVVGGQHAEIYEGLPGCANVGYVVDGEVYHPGDSLFVPQVPIGTLLVPASAPWLKLAEALDFVRAIQPRRAYPIHDAMLNDLGLGNFDAWMQRKGNTSYARIPLGDSINL